MECGIYLGQEVTVVVIPKGGKESEWAQSGFCGACALASGAEAGRSQKPDVPYQRHNGRGWARIFFFEFALRRCCSSSGFPPLRNSNKNLLITILPRRRSND